MRLVNDQESGQVSEATGYYQVYEDGSLRYTQDGLREYAPMFRRHGLDIRQIATLADHEAAYWRCLELDMRAAIRHYAEMDAIDRKVMEHVSEYKYYRATGQLSLADMHEQAAYALKGLSTDAERQAFYEQVLASDD